MTEAPGRLAPPLDDGRGLEHLQAGDRARDARDWPAAEQAYRRRLDAAPDDAAIWVQYGHALKEQGKLDAAEAAYRKALSFKPNEADTWLQLGHALKLRGQERQAGDAYVRSYWLLPSDASREEAEAMGRALPPGAGRAAPLPTPAVQALVPAAEHRPADEHRLELRPAPTLGRVGRGVFSLIGPARPRHGGGRQPGPMDPGISEDVRRLEGVLMASLPTAARRHDALQDQTFEIMADVALTRADIADLRASVPSRTDLADLRANAASPADVADLRAELRVSAEARAAEAAQRLEGAVERLLSDARHRHEAVQGLHGDVLAHMARLRSDMDAQLDEVRTELGIRLDALALSQLRERVFGLRLQELESRLAARQDDAGHAAERALDAALGEVRAHAEGASAAATALHERVVASGLQIDRLAQDAEAGRRQVDALAQEADAGRRQLDALAQAVDAGNRRLDQLAQGAEAGAQRVDGLAARAEAAGQQLAALLARADTVVQQLDRLAQGADANAPRVDALVARAEAADRQLGGLLGRADAAGQQLGTLLARVDVADQQFGILLARADATGQQLGTLAARADVADQQFGVLQGRADGTDRQLGTLVARADLASQQLSALLGRADTSGQQLGGVLARADTLGQQLDRLAKGTEAVSQQTGTLLLRTEEIMQRRAVPVGQEFAVRTDEGYLLVPSEDEGLLLAMIETAGRLEPGTLSVILALLQPGGTMVDVGANVGTICLPASRRVGPRGHVFALEPTPRIAALLRRSIALNGLSKRVTVLECAAGEAEGRARLALSAATTHNSLLPLSDAVGQVEVAVRPLDTCVPASQQIDLVKIDAEGMELEVWRGMKRVIAENPRLAVVVEYGPSHLQRAGTSIVDWIAELRAPGFVPWEIDEATGTLRPLREHGLAEVYSMNLLLLRDPPEGRAGLRLA